MARAKAPATLHGQPLKWVCVEHPAHRTAHLVNPEPGAGTFQLPSTLHYSPVNDVAPYHSPFRPAKFNQFQVTGIEITDRDVLVHSTGGTVRLPVEQVAYSYQLDTPAA